MRAFHHPLLLKILFIFSLGSALFTAQGPLAQERVTSSGLRISGVAKPTLRARVLSASRVRSERVLSVLLERNFPEALEVYISSPNSAGYKVEINRNTQTVTSTPTKISRAVFFRYLEKLRSRTEIRATQTSAPGGPNGLPSRSPASKPLALTLAIAAQ